jgi:hypothetical protein
MVISPEKTNSLNPYREREREIWISVQKFERDRREKKLRG